MVLHRPSDQWLGVVGVFGWGWGVIALKILGVVMGAAAYLWLLAWGCLRLGGYVMEATGSEGLGFGVYFILGVGGLALPFALAAAYQ